MKARATPKNRSPLRLTGGLAVRAVRWARMYCRLLYLRASGVHCSGFSYIDRRCRVSTPKHISIGGGCVIGKCHLYALDKVTIGSNTIVGDDVFLCTGTHDIDTTGFELVTGPILIGDSVWIANGATILPGVTVANGAVIGARAVVSRDVPAGAVVVGNPGRVIRVRTTYPKRETLHLVRVDVRDAIDRLRGSLARQSTDRKASPKTE